MTFSSERNKFRKMWDDTILNEFQILSLSEKNKIILRRVSELNRKNTSIKNFNNLSSGWLVPESNDSFTQVYLEYSIEINNIRTENIPYVKPELSYRLGDSDKSIPIPTAEFDDTLDFDEDIIVEKNSINQVEGGGNNKQITHVSSIYLEGGNIPEEIQFQFFFTFYNPAYYQSDV